MKRRSSWCGEHGTSRAMVFAYPPREPLTLTLVPSSELKVTVVDSETGAPLSARFKWPDAKDEVVISPFHQDGPGQFTATGLTPGTHRLVVEAEGHAGQDFEFNPRPPAPVKLVVPLAPEHRVRGHVELGGRTVTGTATLLTPYRGAPLIKGAVPEVPFDHGEITCELDELKVPFNIEPSGDFELEAGTGEYLLRFEEDCESGFKERVDESSPRYCHWLYETFGVNEPRRRGDLMIDSTCPAFEQRLRVPHPAPLALKWKYDRARVVIEVFEPGGKRAEDVRVTVTRGGTVVAWDLFERGEARVLLAPGTYVVRASTVDDTEHASATFVVAGTSVVTTVRVKLR